MGIDNKIFTTGKTKSILLKFAIPTIISLLVVELYNMVDTVFVGRHVGTDAIGALTLAFPVQRLLSALALLVGVGTTTIVARNLGEKNYDELKKTIINSLVLNMGILITVILSLYIFKEKIIYFLGASEVTYPLAQEYISIILIGGLFQGLGIVMCCIMTALGNTKITLLSNSLGAVTNIIVDFILVALLGFGVKGAAFATVLSQFLAFLFALIKFMKVKRYYSLNFTMKGLSKHLSFDMSKVILSIGFSTFIVEISDAVVAVILNNLLYVKGGDAAVVMIGIITRVSMFMFIAIIGISSSMQPIVAYNYGAENYEEMRNTLKVSMKTVTFISVVFWAILIIFSNGIIGFFLKDKSLLNETVKAFRMCISILPTVGLYYIAIYFYQAIGDAKNSFFLSIYRQLVIFIPISLVLINFMGVPGAWISFPISDAISALTSIYFLYKVWNLDFEYDTDESYA